MKSRIYGIRNIIELAKRIISTIQRDKVSVYAAQASFFVITSAVPFISLLFGAAGLILPDADALSEMTVGFTDNVIIAEILNDLREAPQISLLSISAVTALWTASHGISAIRQGVETVYDSDNGIGFVRHRMNSVVTTILFILSLSVLTLLLLFGDRLINLVSGYIGVELSSMLSVLRMPSLALIMVIFFTAMYASIARRSEQLPQNIFRHIPGAVFSAVGWMTFSHLYSLYISFFPNASKVYGSLSAICLIMLWLYFCMIILLLGAEINKLLCFSRKTHTTQ